MLAIVIKFSHSLVGASSQESVGLEMRSPPVRRAAMRRFGYELYVLAPGVRVNVHAMELRAGLNEYH